MLSVARALATQLCYIQNPRHPSTVMNRAFCSHAALLSVGPMALQAPYQIVLHNPSWGGVPNSWNVHVEEASTGLILGERHCATAAIKLVRLMSVAAV